MRQESCIWRQPGTAARGVCARHVPCGERTTARRCERCVARRCCSGAGADEGLGTSESENVRARLRGVEFGANVKETFMCEVNVTVHVRYKQHLEPGTHPDMRGGVVGRAGMRGAPNRDI